MKIIHTVNYFNAQRGYAEYYLAKEQMKMGHEVLIITFNLQNPRSSTTPQYHKSGFSVEEGINVVRVPCFYAVYGNPIPPKIFKIQKILKDFVPSIIHCHGLLSPIAWVMALYKNFYRYALVGDIITFPINLSSFKRRLTFQLYRRSLGRLVFRNTDAFFAATEAVGKWICLTLDTPPSRVNIIPKGADHKLFRRNLSERDNIRRILGINKADIVAVHSGKFIPSKKIEDLLVASAPLIKKHSNFKILLIGDGSEPYVSYLKKLITTLGIQGNVIIHKTVHRTELPNFYSASDFAVWPGHISISKFEAMSMGMPVILSDMPFTYELPRYGCAFVFDEGNIKELQYRMAILLQNEALRRRMGVQARQIIDDKFNWPVISKMYLNVYELAIKKKRYFDKNHQYYLGKNVSDSLNI